MYFGGAYHWLPLMYAARNGASGAVIRRLVMEQPHAVRIPDCDGWLPIHYSSYTGNSEACAVLLEACQNSIYALTQANSSEFGGRYKSLTSKTPLQLAKEQGMWPTVTTLKNFIEKYEKMRWIKSRKYKMEWSSSSQKNALVSTNSHKHIAHIMLQLTITSPSLLG